MAIKFNRKNVSPAEWSGAEVLNRELYSAFKNSLEVRISPNGGTASIWRPESHDQVTTLGIRDALDRMVIPWLTKSVARNQERVREYPEYMEAAIALQESLDALVLACQGSSDRWIAEEIHQEFLDYLVTTAAKNAA